jgi:hypothetical protein
MYRGSGPLDLCPPAGHTPILTGRIVTDFRALFVADPFLVLHDSVWHLFFEAMDGDRKHGVIALATSPDARQWTYQGLVLREPFHLSYPYVIRSHGQYFMVPESGLVGSVRLYRADPFPFRWKFERVILNRGYADASPFEWDGRWWIFCSRGGNDSLLLFHADRLTGPWIEHPSNPVMCDNVHHSRPAGRVIQWNGHLHRFAQDCAPYYGTRVWPLRITRMNTREYRDELAGGAVVGPGGESWNRGGMHHVDACSVGPGQWLAAVDGWFEG